MQALPDAQPVAKVVDVATSLDDGNLHLQAVVLCSAAVSIGSVLYAALRPAPAPEPVRLTDEEIEAIGLAATKAGGRNMPMVFARAIEDAIHAKAGKS